MRQHLTPTRSSWGHLLRVLVLGVCLTLGTPLLPAYADVGPKPEMRFQFVFEGDATQIVSGQLLECEDESCAEGEPLEELGPQRFECTESECTSLAYGYAPYHKLVIEFEDGTRESNVFEKQAFRAQYEVQVTADALQVEEKRRLLGGGMCCPSLGLTLIVETAIAMVYLRAFGLSQAALPWVPLASMLTLPAVWLAFPALGLGDGWALGLGESFAFAAEGALLYAASWRSTPLKHVVALSAIMNGASLALGLLI
jgi:hypothetical protein